MDAKPVHIYRLSSSESPDEFRYVGQTVKWPLVRRNHTSGNMPVNRWVRKVKAAGHSVGYHLIRTVSAEEADEAEIAAIAEHRAAGYNLLNIQAGGKASRGYKCTEESTENKRRAWANMSPERRQARVVKISEAVALHWQDPDVRARRSDAIRAALARPDVKRRRSEAMKRVTERPGNIEARRAAAIAAHQRPEVKERSRAAQQEVARRPEIIAQRKRIAREINARPDVKQRISDANKGHWSKPGEKERRGALIRAGMLRSKVGDAPTLFDAPDENAA